jgi:hypothetical protein
LRPTFTDSIATGFTTADDAVEVTSVKRKRGEDGCGLEEYASILEPLQPLQPLGEGFLNPSTGMTMSSYEQVTVDTDLDGSMHLTAMHLLGTEEFDHRGPPVFNTVSAQTAMFLPRKGSHRGPHDEWRDLVHTLPYPVRE